MTNALRDSAWNYSCQLDLVTLKFRNEENLQKYLEVRSQQLLAMISILRNRHSPAMPAEVKDELFRLLADLSQEMEQLGRNRQWTRRDSA